MLNKVILKGNVGREPNFSLTQDGRKVASFSLATTVSWKDAAEKWHSSTDWHGIVIFRESTIAWVKKNIHRGDTVYIEGKLTYHQKRDRYGHIYYVAHVTISGHEGKIEYLRSPASRSKSSQDLENQESQNQESQIEDSKLDSHFPQQEENEDPFEDDEDDFEDDLLGDDSFEDDPFEEDSFEDDAVESKVLPCDSLEDNPVRNSLHVQNPYDLFQNQTKPTLH